MKLLQKKWDNQFLIYNTMAMKWAINLNKAFFSLVGKNAKKAFY